MKSILVVDDEAGIRLMIRAILQYEGYQVDVACNPDEAIAMYKKRLHDMVITDMCMGEDGAGTKVISALNRSRTKLLVITGYTEQKIEWPVLMKPFHISNLLKLVKESLCYTEGSSFK